ncbi:hypothetical protein, variant 2 [Aphanomyces invadans]|uniref:NAD/GMP synthase domain-containing protein n=1 Tax=Aphanomyces invadans TaxID=157072 RepID=A0A024U784_9STRA|nr:hypothetical protein, variant 2 [Aphanomyces invadans]ETW01433.1 hypothetical protein, variant 2 [Aphanomyces invadans]|eukprot:XP_008870431.1 hypothetical protein, variant 2 [Aphanomyces invadans]
MLLENLLARVRHAGSSKHVNVVAYSGGVDSSLVAALVHRVFPENSIACLGVSAALSQDQLTLARDVATAIGIPLWETRTSEGEDPRYVENKGQSCYYCKTNLYTTLSQVAERVKAQSPGVAPVLFNGTNADDKFDPTRLGLVAATEFQVVSPLENLTKASVRQISKQIGLPNWNYAASPCLRSRLAFGVAANPDHLARIEKAEHAVRSTVALTPVDNLRVRFLAHNRAAVELDAATVRALLPRQVDAIQVICKELGTFSDRCMLHSSEVPRRV